ncbi:MAG: iron-containing alcohol dehydrogenase, partial [Bacilli bacterium]|nr:iron-containing alcohol dehydrogenase [Bacilli bacterium]
MMVNRVVLNETSYFGRGARNNLATEIKSRGFHKILLVTDKTLFETKVVDMVTRVLEHNTIGYYLFYDIKPNPTL